jgi:hypothetical protein
MEDYPQIIAEALGNVRFERWYSMGIYAECRLCGHRPSDKWGFQTSFPDITKTIYPWAWYCGTCKHRTMKFGLVRETKVVEMIAERIPQVPITINNNSSTTVADTGAGIERGEKMKNQTVQIDAKSRDEGPGPSQPSASM